MLIYFISNAVHLWPAGVVEVKVVAVGEVHTAEWHLLTHKVGAQSTSSSSSSSSTAAYVRLEHWV
jgi:hypothetical protein